MLRLSQTCLPAGGLGIGGDDGLHMRQKIYFPFASITYALVTGNRHMMLKPMYAVQDTTSTGTWQLLSSSYVSKGRFQHGS
jgi:hypothetical protein